MNGNKFGIIIPGFNIKASLWQHVMFGDLKTRQFGRITKGLERALQDDARFVYWGGGNDAEETLFRAQREQDNLSEVLGADVSRFMSPAIAHVGLMGTRTAHEMSEALMTSARLKVGRLHLVSDKVHYLRCVGHLVSLREKLGLDNVVALDVFTSHTRFSDKDPVVAEPPTDYRDNLYDVIVKLLEMDARLNGNAAEIKRRLLEFITELRVGLPDMDGLEPSAQVRL